LEEPGVGSRMESNSEIGNKKIGSEDMDWNPKPDTSEKDHSAQKTDYYHKNVSDCVNNFCVAKANNYVHKFRFLDIKPGKNFWWKQTMLKDKCTGFTTLHRLVSFAVGTAS
jgi:hypothetical protein